MHTDIFTDTVFEVCSWACCMKEGKCPVMPYTVGSEIVWEIEWDVLN